MTYEEMIEELKARSSEKYKANVVRMGIPERGCIGVSMADVRQLARRAGKSDALARALWASNLHEARLLAVLVFDAKKLSHDEITGLMDDVISWDLCDHLCKNLIFKRKDYHAFISEWVSGEALYRKRAAFTLIASAAVHEKHLTEERVEQYLEWIRHYSADGREHVKKAASWALREIGKIDFAYNEKAVLLAQELAETGDKTQAFIARDALKELENVVQAEGRKRLISADTQMGRLA